MQTLLKELGLLGGKGKRNQLASRCVAWRRRQARKGSGAPANTGGRVDAQPNLQLPQLPRTSGEEVRLRINKGIGEALTFR